MKIETYIIWSPGPDFLNMLMKISCILTQPSCWSDLGLDLVKR